MTDAYKASDINRKVKKWDGPWSFMRVLIGVLFFLGGLLLVVLPFYFLNNYRGWIKTTYYSIFGY